MGYPSKKQTYSTLKKPVAPKKPPTYQPQAPKQPTYKAPEKKKDVYKAPEQKKNVYKSPTYKQPPPQYKKAPVSKPPQYKPPTFKQFPTANRTALHAGATFTEYKKTRRHIV